MGIDDLAAQNCSQCTPVFKICAVMRQKLLWGVPPSLLKIPLSSSEVVYTARAIQSAEAIPPIEKVVQPHTIMCRGKGSNGGRKPGMGVGINAKNKPCDNGLPSTKHDEAAERIPLAGGMVSFDLKFRGPSGVSRAQAHTRICDDRRAWPESRLEWSWKS